MTTKLPDDVLTALEQAKRTSGWNMRRGDIQRFTLTNGTGRRPCRLYVVPARRWIYQRWERLHAGQARECAA